MRRKKPKNVETPLKLEMTAMIDIVFNLLIFFLCSPFKIPEGQLDAFLPRGTGPPKQSTVEKVIVVLRDTGGDIPFVFVGRNRLRSDANAEPVFDDLALALIERKEKAAEMSDEKLPVEIDSDMGVKYRYVVGVLNACTKARIEDIRFTLPIGEPAKPPG
jgi:biopolymer transport protein ExbD